MLKTFDFTLKVNHKQESMLQQHVGASRFIYNQMLALKINLYNNYNTNISRIDLINLLPSLKIIYPWLTNIESSSLQQSIINLDKAYTNFFNSGFGFPKFKSKHRSRKSFRIVYNNNNIRIENNRLKLPKLGYFNIYSVKKRLARLPDNYNIKSVTITFESDQKWHCTLLIECENQATLPLTYNLAGIDLGIKNNYTVANQRFTNISNQEFSYQVINSPIPYSKYEEKLKKLNRELSRRKKGSSNWTKTKLKLTKLYGKLARIRKDFNNKLTTWLVKYHDVISIENLNLDSMKQNNLGKKISDLNFYQFRTMLEYKCEWYKKILLIVNRFFASSKLCSSCLTKNDSLKRDDYSWTCQNCGTHHDRDENAATNLALTAQLRWINSSIDNITTDDFVQLRMQLTI